METKRPKGITIFAWLLIILNIFTLLLSLNFKNTFDLYKSFNKIIIIAIILYGLFSTIIGIISGFGILRLKEIMRKIAVAISALDVLFTIIIIFMSSNEILKFSYSLAGSQLVGKSNMYYDADMVSAIGFYSMIFVYVLSAGLSLLFIFFFTRPKVIEQFK